MTLVFYERPPTTRECIVGYRVGCGFFCLIDLAVGWSTWAIPGNQSFTPHSPLAVDLNRYDLVPDAQAQAQKTLFRTQNSLGRYGEEVGPRVTSLGLC